MLVGVGARRGAGWFDALLEAIVAFLTISTKWDAVCVPLRSKPGSAHELWADGADSLKGLSGSGEAEREGLAEVILLINTTESATRCTCMCSCLTASTTWASLHWSRCWQ